MSMNHALNPDFVHSRFAGLEQDGWALFDNAGGSLALHATADRVADYLRSTPVQLGGSYPLSMQAADRQRASIGKLRRMINAEHDEEVVIGGSATALVWQVARGLLSSLEPGDEIIITRMDHEANRSPWLALRRYGIVIRELDVCPDTWQLDREQLRELLSERTRLVCISQCSNILGGLEPVADIAADVHAAGAQLFVDSVAVAPHRQIDVRQLDADFLVMSLYKVFGPHAGLLYGKRDALLALDNLNHEYLDADAIPYRLQPGGASYELVYGATAIPDYLAELDILLGGNGDSTAAWQAIAYHETELMEPLLEYLASLEQVQLLGRATTEARLPIISFRVQGRSNKEIVTALEKDRLACRSGHFHARRLLESLEVDPVDGVVRISLAHYNTKEEMQRLMEGLKKELGTGS